MKATRLLALLTSLALLMTAAPPGALGKDKKEKKKKIIWRETDLSAFFVEEGRLLVSERQGRLMIVSFPEMEVVAEIEGGDDSPIADVRVSRDRKWLAARYKNDRLGAWNLTTLEPALMLEQGVTPTFRLHPKEDRLVVFQKKIGITQWDLRTGATVGPTISDVVVGPGRMWIAPNGKYLLMEGICRADGDRWDQCIFDLRDGSAVVWADDPTKSTSFASEKHLALLEEFNELVKATGFVRTAPAPPGCERRDDGLLFCCSISSVALTDESREPERASEGGGGLTGFFKQTMEQSRPAEFPGRLQWKIAATNERKRFKINSCDLSESGEWVALAVNSEEVLLYSTGQLEPAALKLMGKWQQPVLVSSFELP